jgi:hypothetical protein
VFSVAVKKVPIKTYKTLSFPVVLYGCEALSLTLREEHKLTVLDNRMLRKLFGPKRNEIIDWRKLHT